MPLHASGNKPNKKLFVMGEAHLIARFYIIKLIASVAEEIKWWRFLRRAEAVHRTFARPLGQITLPSADPPNVSVNHSRNTTLWFETKARYLSA
jgi:hypothetical protein